MRDFRQYVVCQVNYQPGPPDGIACMALMMRHSGCLVSQIK